MACSMSIVDGLSTALHHPLSYSPGRPGSLLNPRLVRAPAVSGNGAGYNGSRAQQGGELQVQQQKTRDIQPVDSRRRPRDSSLLLLDSWDPFSRGGLRQMMDTMDRLFFDDLVPTRSSGGRGSAATRSATSGIRAPWDVVEDEDVFYIRVDMPGFSKEDVKVSVEDGVLVVSGQRDPDKEDTRWAAKSYSKCNTRLALPDNVQVDKISAEFKNGVLFVAVPKLKPEDRKHVVDIQVS